MIRGLYGGRSLLVGCAIAAGLVAPPLIVAVRRRLPRGTGSGGSSSSSSSSGSSSTSTGGGSGWSAGSGVELTASNRSWLDELAASTNVPIYVTSGVRSAEAQARAMLAKVKAGQDASDLHALYKRDDLVDELVNLTADQATWAAQIQQQIDRGDYLSSHLTRYALDLRTKNLTAAQLAELEAKATSLGARVVVESVPPHMHLELPR